jgi:hypothetical protein
MPKYPHAIYYDAKGEQQKLFPDELHDTERRAFARSSELWDPDEEYRLFPRYREDSPHFYSLSNSARAFSRVLENDPAHDARVLDLLKELSSDTNFRVGFYEWDGTEKQFISFTQTRNYSWGKEVTRALTANLRCRHDLFGASKDLKLTARFPWVAIEVVKHHYPDDQTFSALLSLTKELPCVILFDFIDVPNYFLHVDRSAGDIRVIYYIYDGSVWKNDCRWKSCTPAFFREKVAEHIQQVLAKRT